MHVRPCPGARQEIRMRSRLPSLRAVSTRLTCVRLGVHAKVGVRDTTPH